MMIKSVRVGVVGTGAISKEHLAFLSGNTNNKASDPARIELVGVADVSLAAATYTARCYNTDPFTDMTALLETAHPDVVHILTPPWSHVALCTQALGGGAHVICEKPITPSGAELEPLQALAAARGLHLIESHNYRFNDEVEALMAAIKDGKIGAVREVEIRINLAVVDPDGRFADPNIPNPIHQMPAGVIHDFITHMSYLTLALSGGATFDEVITFFRNHSRNRLFKYDNLDSILIGLRGPDPVHARLRFDAEAGPEMFAVVVRGTHGYVETDLFQPYVRLVTPRVADQLSSIANHMVNGISLAASGVRNFKNKLLQNSPYHGLHQMLDQTYASFQTGTSPPISPTDIQRSSALIDRLVASNAPGPELGLGAEQ